MKPFEYSGVWWLPSTEEHKVTGTVQFENEGQINIALDNLLEPERGSLLKSNENGVLQMPPLKHYPIILGLANNNLLITLFDCFESGLTLNFEGYGKHQCLAHVAYIGAHFKTLEELRFDKIDVCYNHLPEWAGVFPFRGYQESFSEISASTTKGKITVHPASSLGKEWISEPELQESVYITIESNEALPLEAWNTQLVLPFQNFLNLATQRTNFIVSIQAYIKQKEVIQQNGDNSEFPIQIVFPPAFVPFAPSKTAFPQTILFSLQDIADNFSLLLDNWLRIADELDSVCNLFFGVQYTKLYLEQRFLFIAQAAEVYQNRRTERLYLPENEFQNLVQEILEGCPENHRDWLKDKIQYSNKPTFRRHLKDLINNTSDILLPIFGNTSRAKSDFVDAVYNTRNYFTHHTRELRTEAAQGDALFFITQRLSIVVQVCLLKELGFTDERCIQMLSKHEIYQYLLGLQPYSS